MTEKLQLELDHARDAELRYQRLSEIYEKELELKAAEIERLRAALEEIRDEIVYCGGEEPDIDKLHDIARAALRGKIKR